MEKLNIVKLSILQKKPADCCSHSLPFLDVKQSK